MNQRSPTTMSPAAIECFRSTPRTFSRPLGTRGPAATMGRAGRSRRRRRRRALRRAQQYVGETTGGRPRVEAAAALDPQPARHERRERAHELVAALLTQVSAPPVTLRSCSSATGMAGTWPRPVRPAARARSRPARAPAHRERARPRRTSSTSSRREVPLTRARCQPGEPAACGAPAGRPRCGGPAAAPRQERRARPRRAVHRQHPR